MARPFPNTFEQDSPMTPQSASSISYQPNVNRQKTKKWAEAKAVNYGGDDWGGDDDYGAPLPVSKPTGLRQPGQGLQSSVKPESSAFDNAKKYGELPPLPDASDFRGRSNSFDPEDEKRNFSSSTARQPSPATATPVSNAPATRFSQITRLPSSRNASGPPALQIQTQQPQPPIAVRKASQIVSPISGSPHPDILLPGRGNSGENSVVSPASETASTASDFHARRDFSPSAVPPPLTTRASPALQSATDSPSTRFPARKSSLSQVTGPPLADITRPSQDTTKPWVAGRSASPGAASRSSATPTGKALPFIRPADIYKRAEEERQSLESGRPSMDSITGARFSDRSDSPAISQLKEKSSSDSLGGGGRRVTSFEGDDASESGRRLMPMLEPVRERKSEYGFDGFKVNEKAAQAGAATGTMSESTTAGEFDEEEARRLSVSPKLPDLSRLSSFGIDMFSQPTTEASETPAAKVAETTPIASTASHPPTEVDLTLRTQPTFGFRSVVNQAFERSDDTSVPATPASISGGEIRRTDSESTSTTGISPIMSRGPSGVNRDAANPSILEVVHEPVTPDVSAEKQVGDVQRGRDVPGFKPGYRRDISTPRSDNSPARTPDLTQTKIITSGQHAVVSTASPEIYSPQSEPLQPPRPVVEREESFRPSLPGGWTSYATSAQSENPSAAPSVRAQTPVHEVALTNEQGEGALDITPTTEKHALPESELGAAVDGAALVGTTEAVLGEHDRDSHVTDPASDRVLPSNSALPTLDTAMAPGGNLYSTTTLDPKLLPKLEQAPAETQLRPDAVNRDVLAASSVAPTPPPKDSPDNHAGNEGSEDFPRPTVPLKPRVSVPVGADEALMPPMRHQMLPALSTDIHPNDEENDKLRKEIVKSLSPRPSDARPSDGADEDENMLSDELDEGNYPKQGHESTYLPREYDNYWASTSDDQEDVEAVPLPVEEQVEKPEPIQPEASSAPKHEEVYPPVIAPLNPRRQEQPSLEPPRPSLTHRFSWEGGNDNVNVGAANDEVSEVSAASSPVRPPQGAEASVAPSNTLSTAQHQTGTIHPDYEHQIQTPPVAISQVPQEQHDIGSEVALATGGVAALGAAAAATYTHIPILNSQRRLSLAEEKDPRVSSHLVSPTPPEDEHPARAAQPYFAPSPNESSPNLAPSTVSPVASPVLQQPFPPPTGKLLTFKDIAKMPTASQRIENFDSTRQRFATMESGLGNWMAYLRSQHPEHASVGPSFGGVRTSALGGTGRSRFGRSTGGTASPMQQPYYQQYLNASSPATPSTPVSRHGPGPNMGPGSQGFSSNSGKLTSQQVQAKGKELLYSANIFGNKAGKAGKGLLAKGKSKFLGGGDKTSPPPKPKNEHPKQERRASWGLPLNLSRSSGRLDGSGRESREFSPQPERTRAATSTSDRSFPARQLPNVSVSDSLGVMSRALPTVNGMSAQNHQGPATIRPVQPEMAAEESELRDSLGVPAPIGKHQSSWDPYNATPISEEEGFQYEQRPKQRQLSSDMATPQGALAVPHGTKSGSERSNSDDTHFYSAPEDTTEITNDWVMVSSNQEAKEGLPASQPAQSLKAEPSVEPESRKSMDAPVPSILNRPRGSSYMIPSPPPSAKGPTPKLTEPSTVVAEPVLTPPPSKPVQAQPEKQAGTSFLPPIRRTSTFGLGFGSRHPKPRFALEDEDEQNTPENAAPEPVGTTAMNRATQGGSPSQSTSSLVRGPEIGTVTNVPIASENSSGSKPQGSQQPPVRTDQARQSSRPLSFVQTSGSGEVLNTPFKGGEQNSTASEPVQRDAPAYQQPGQPRDEVLKLQPPETTSQQVAPSQSSARPPLAQAGSYEYSRASAQSQRTMLPPPAPQLAMAPGASEAIHPTEQSRRSMLPPSAAHRPQPPPFVTPRAADVLQRPEFRESQVEWRPNRPKAAEPPSQVSLAYWKEIGMPPPTTSMEHQRRQGSLGSSQSYLQRPDGQYNERAAWAGPPLQQSPYQQPPSSAQRYPELFRPGQAGADVPRDGSDLPAQYYQAPIARAEAFLPRHQTNEYQIPGVGPPTDEPRSATSKRNSGLFKEIGGKLSRASSRDRQNSISRDEGAPSPVRPFESRGNEYAESSVASEGELEQRKRRSSFFGNLGRNSTSGLGPPQSRESVIAHNSASRTDLMASPQPSPTAHQDKKRSFFNSSKDPKEKSNKLARASTGSTDTHGKKNRFSGLSSMFSKSNQPVRGSVQERPQATRELLHSERQPIQSSQLNSRRPAVNTPPSGQARAPSQTRQMLKKLTPSTSPRPEDKARRTSGSGLLGGLMARKPNQQEKRSDDSRSQGSQPQLVPQPLPPAQTYTDLREQLPEQRPVAPPPQQQREFPFQDPSLRVDRGRRVSREPQYDNVPIPGGYSLVRGQGAVPVPTEYDPRVLNRFQQQVDPRHAQQFSNGAYQTNGSPVQRQPQQFLDDARYGPQPQQPQFAQDRRHAHQPNPHLGAIEGYDNYAARTIPRRLSRENMLARSPPKSPEGQQRPYQLSLPDGENDHRPVPLDKDPIVPGPAHSAVKQPQKPQHDAIQRLQQPILRHPESPAGYPLPEDTVFSPINPSANDIPPPPPPQWPSRAEPQQLDSQNTQHDRHTSLSTMDGDLGRSNTRRTAVSDISGLSAPRPESGGLNVPNRQISDATETDRDRRHLASPSPSPPSPLRGTPERNVSPHPQTQAVDPGRLQIQIPNQEPRHGNDMRTTELRVAGSREDLYNASPRLPKLGIMLAKEFTSANGNGNANITSNHGNLQPPGKENMNVGRSVSAILKPTDSSSLQPEENVTRAASSSQAQEEKIPYQGVVGRAELPVVADDGPAEMSATSYPGMEWNPYAAGAWDDGYD